MALRKARWQRKGFEKQGRLEPKHQTGLGLIELLKFRGTIIENQLVDGNWDDRDSGYKAGVRGLCLGLVFQQGVVNNIHGSLFCTCEGRW